MDSERPEKSLEELLSELERLGISREQALAYAESEAAKRQHVVDIPTDEPTVADLSAKLDKLQEAVERIAAKLDAKDSA
jgi:chromosome segregation ATPase